MSLNLLKILVRIQLLAAMMILAAVSQAEATSAHQRSLRRPEDGRLPCDEVIGELATPLPRPYRLQLKNLRPATTQCVGNCQHHQAAGAAEYLAEALSGKRILLSRAYLSANSMREVAYQVIDRDLDSELIGIGEYEDQVFRLAGGFWGLIEKYGVLPEDIGPKDYQLFEIAGRLRSLMHTYREKRDRIKSDADLATLKSFFRFRIDQTLKEYGCNPDQKIVFDKGRSSPREIAVILQLNGIKWNAPTNGTASALFEAIERAISLGLPVTADIWGEDADKELGFTQAYIRNGVNKNPAKRRSRWRVITSAPYGNSDVNSGHSLMIVGTSVDAEENKFLILQNSWGPTVYGREGLVPVPLEAFRAHSGGIFVPEASQTTLPASRPIRSSVALTPNPPSIRTETLKGKLTTQEAWMLATQTFNAVAGLDAMSTLAQPHGYSVFLTGVSALRLLNFVEQKVLELGSLENYEKWLREKKVLVWNEIAPGEEELEIALLANLAHFRDLAVETSIEKSLIGLVRDEKFARSLKIRIQTEFRQYAERPNYFNALDRILISDGMHLVPDRIDYFLNVYGQKVNLQNWGFGSFISGEIDADSNAAILKTIDEDAEAISRILLQLEIFKRGKLTIRTQEFIQRFISRCQREAPGRFDPLIARANAVLASQRTQNLHRD